jgi:hypothetical protein
MNPETENDDDELDPNDFPEEEDDEEEEDSPEDPG